ncbi:MAG: exodeoxyribonuclease VII large subunit [Clostridia bacterium]|nr:exodeoxyribonuclease VII large subunit [Clostridia bacterium]
MEQSTRFLTVSQINEYVKMLMDSNPVLKNVWVKGEISNFKNHYSTGHLYFSLKDDTGLLRAVMFRTSAQKLNFLPKDGMKVLVRGRISAFVRDGQYQIYAEEMVPDGVGALYLAFEQLKQKLAARGLFDEARKKPLPKYPARIGIVTSPTGAAIRDMLNILGRRFPCAEIRLYPAQVQGPDAPPQLIRGIEYFNKSQSADVIIVGRGGGSAEDLWAFNDERLALCVAASKIPVISAVGHESDFTICDFVADRRAPTPSAAAELAVPDREELLRSLAKVSGKLSSVLSRRIETDRSRLKLLRESGVLSGAAPMLNEKRMMLLYMEKNLDGVLRNTVTRSSTALSGVAARLEALSPLSVLARGYSVVTDADGASVRSISRVKVEDDISVRVSDGTLVATVKSVQKEKKQRGN